VTERFEHHMSDADALMWNVERDPALRSTIVTALVLDRRPKWSELLARIERGTRLIPRMRQRVVVPAFRLGPPAWSADPDFDLAYHVRRMRVPKPRSFSSVLDVVATAAMGDFDRARPLWEYTLVEGLPDGRAALVIKVHHSMTDGVGGMKLLLMLFDLQRDGGDQGPDPEPVELPMFTPLGLLGDSFAYQQKRLVESTGHAFDGVRSAVRAVRDDVEHSVGRGAAAAGSIARYLAPATTPLSPTINERSLDRRVATFDLPLDDLKRAAKSAGGTLNDAFVAGVVGGLRRYHDDHGGACDVLRMVMPINLRGEGATLGGNHFTPARLLVPLGIDDPAERIRAIGESTRQLRDEPAVALTAPIAAVLNRMPRRLATLLFGSMLKGADFVTSNVPGAPFPMYVCGSEVQRMYAFAPLSGTAANVTLLSHCGTCCIGVNTDARAIPDTDEFKTALDTGLQEILALA
jgi:diacylglycerol O-acyltransferase / wax synthase